MLASRISPQALPRQVQLSWLRRPKSQGYPNQRAIVSMTPMASSASTGKYWWEESQRISSDSTTSLPPGRIHILGLGAIGCLLAHGLASLPDSHRPPLTLLFHRPGLWDDFNAQDQRIRLIRNADGIEDAKGGFDVDVLAASSGASAPAGTTQPSRWQAVARQEGKESNDAAKDSESDGEIVNLIVITKAAATVPAIRSVRHRLRPSSTILFIQNGMGQLDELNDEVFSDPSSRPHYMQGIISHGLYLKEPFMPVHAGMGNITMGMVPHPSQPLATSISSNSPQDLENSHWPASARSLYLTLSHPHPSNFLNIPASPLPYASLLTTQFLKVAANAVNNTLTPLLDILNGHQLTNPHIANDVIPDLVAEISNIFLNLPELQKRDDSNSMRKEEVLIDRSRFTRESLEPFAKQMIYQNRTNSSSTREDINKGRDTELDYICGYLFRRADEVGVEAKWLRLLLALVKARGWEVKEAMSGNRNA